MTITATTPRITYAGDGVTVDFAVPFAFFGSDEIKVIEKVIATGVETVKTLTTHYTVSGGNGSTGTVTAVSAPPGTVTWTLSRMTKRTQEVDYTPNDDFPAETHERALDRSMAVAQEIDDAVSRSAKLSETSSLTEITLPDPELDKLIGWKADLSGIENKTLPVGQAVYASIASTNSGATAAEAVTPAGLAGSKFNATGRHMLPIVAAAMQSATTNGAAPGAVETTTNKLLYRTLDFDSATQEFAGFVLPMPKGWDEASTITFRARWTAASSSGGVAWALQAVALSDDDALDVAYGTEQVVTDTLIATGDNHITGESAAITIAGSPAEGDLVAFRVKRVPANASDTLGADARLIALDIFLTLATANDA